MRAACAVCNNGAMSDETATQQHPQNHETSTRVQLGLGVGLAVVLAAVSFFSGVYFGNASAQTSEGRTQLGLLSAIFGPRVDATPHDEANLDTFWQVWNLMEEKFVPAGTSTATTSVAERVYGATQGLVASYDDPYSVFLPPADANQFAEDISGSFGGVGMEIGLRDGLVTVIAPLAGTPAKEAGLLPGDVIVEVDGTSTEGMSINEAVRLIRGEKGSEVRLQIYREGEPELLDFSITRDTISIPTIDTEQDGDVFIIRLYTFNALAVERMRDALREYLQSGADSLVLDLRGNPGGFLQGAIFIASYFVPEGEVVVSEEFGTEKPTEHYRSYGNVIRRFTPDRFVVLTDGGSASASEIVAGALKEHDIATIIGEQTFGKGSVQELVDLPDGAALKVTIAHWLTPNGTRFSGTGLAPDIEVRRTPEDIAEGVDPQLEAALAWLRGERDLKKWQVEDDVAALRDAAAE